MLLSSIWKSFKSVLRIEIVDYIFIKFKDSFDGGIEQTLDDERQSCVTDSYKVDKGSNCTWPTRGSRGTPRGGGVS